MSVVAIFLRGINVSGQKKIPMADLRAALASGGYPDAQTYIQSGNIILESSESLKRLETHISSIILDTFGFEVESFGRTLRELQDLLKDSPYLTSDRDEKGMYFTLTKEPLDASSLQNVENFDFPPEEITASGKTIYFYSPVGYGKAKMNNNFLERKINSPATTRNLRTIRKMIELGSSY